MLRAATSSARDEVRFSLLLLKRVTVCENAVIGRNSAINVGFNYSFSPFDQKTKCVEEETSPSQLSRIGRIETGMSKHFFDSLKLIRLQVASPM